MKNYELTYLLSGLLGEEELKAFLAKTEEAIKKENGIIEKIKGPNKKKLAYPIKKEKEGFLVSFYFSLDPQKIDGLSKEIKLEKSVLRSIVLFKDPKKNKIEPIFPRPKIREPEIKSDQKNEPEKPMEKPKKIEKTDLNEIDKKIEEILG
jgi:small subunit ribosomal protein S6